MNLRKKRKGKSCFHFKKPEEVTEEVDKLLLKSYQTFQEKKLVE